MGNNCAPCKNLEEDNQKESKEYKGKLKPYKKSAHDVSPEDGDTPMDRLVIQDPNAELNPVFLDEETNKFLQLPNPNNKKSTQISQNASTKKVTSSNLAQKEDNENDAEKRSGDESPPLVDKKVNLPENFGNPIPTVGEGEGGSKNQDKGEVVASPVKRGKKRTGTTIGGNSIKNRFSNKGSPTKGNRKREPQSGRKKDFHGPLTEEGWQIQQNMPEPSQKVKETLAKYKDYIPARAENNPFKTFPDYPPHHNSNSSSTYRGQFHNHMREGLGLEIFDDGSYYTGFFKNDRKDGKGRFIFANGDLFEGTFDGDIVNGTGLFYSASTGVIYEGEFKDNFYHGKGSETFPDGSSYNGDYQDGCKEGKGCWRLPGVGIYSGTVREGMAHGQGEFIYTSPMRRYERYEGFLGRISPTDPELCTLWMGWFMREGSRTG